MGAGLSFDGIKQERRLGTSVDATARPRLLSHRLVSWRTAFARRWPIAIPEPLGGKGKTVEIDETFIGKPDQIFVSGKGWQGKRGTATKRKVLTMVERGGRAVSVKVEDLTVQTLKTVIGEHVVLDSTLNTDEAQHYKSHWQSVCGHEAVNHGAGEYARGETTTNTVEGFFGIFKRGMIGVYQHCGEHHLQAYLNEFDFRYSNRSALGLKIPNAPIARSKAPLASV